MTTCTQERLHWHINEYGEHGLDDKPKPCGMELNQHGLCPFHDLTCDVCGLTLAEAGDRRYGTHKGCQQPVTAPEQPPMSDEAGNAALMWLEGEKNRCGGWAAWRHEGRQTIDEQNRERGVKR